MKTIIIALQEASDIGWNGSELLEKNDRIVFLYPEDNDTISVQVHNALMAIKAKIEFKAFIPSGSILLQYAFLIGQNSAQSDAIFLITKDASFEPLKDMVTICQDFKAVSKGSSKAVAVKKQRQTRTKKEPVQETLVFDETPASIPEPVEKGVTDQNSKKTRTKSVGVKTSEDSHSHGQATIEDFKLLLSRFETKEISPQKHYMSIYEAVVKAISENSSIEDSISSAMGIYGLQNQTVAALHGHYAEMEALAKKIPNKKIS